MALPRIPPYDLPLASELPPAQVPWRPEIGRAILLIHDMQNYFVQAFTPDRAPVAPLVTHILALRDHCDHVGIPVFYSAQPGRQDPRDRGLQTDFWGPGMTDSPACRDIVAALAPRDTHQVLTKWRYSAFQRTNLEPMMRARGRDQIIVCGLYAQIGCLLTAADAFMRDIQPFLVADAVADFSRENHDMALSYAAGRCARVCTVAALIDLLRSPQPRTPS